MSISSVDMAASLAAKAKEVAAAMEVYERLPAHRGALAASCGLLIEDMADLIERLDQKREAEDGQS